MTRPATSDTRLLSALRSISSHAIERYQERVEAVPYHTARLALFRLYATGHNASDYEKKLLRKEFDGETVPRICDTCYGPYCLLVKRGIVVTLWRIND